MEWGITINGERMRMLYILRNNMVFFKGNNRYIWYIYGNICVYIDAYMGVLFYIQWP